MAKEEGAPRLSQQRGAKQPSRETDSDIVTRAGLFMGLGTAVCTGMCMLHWAWFA